VPPGTFGSQGAIEFAAFGIETIGLLMGKVRFIFKVPITTWFTTIPNMAHDAFSGPEHFQTHDTMSFHTNISADNTFDVMNLEHMEHE